MNDFEFNQLALHINKPQLPEFDPPSNHMWAEEQFKIIKRYVQDFEKKLDSEHEVGIMMTNFGQSVLMRVNCITYEPPVLMVFKGIVNEREAILVQHINQLNFLLTTISIVPTHPKRTIGFIANQNE